MKKKALIALALTVSFLVPAGSWAQELFDLEASRSKFEKGLHLYFQEQYSASIREFQEALRINPDDVRAYYFVGYAYYKLRDLEKARKAFEQAYQVNPQYSPIPKGTSQE